MQLGNSMTPQASPGIVQPTLMLHSSFMPQMHRFREAARHLGEGDGALYRELFLQLIDPENRDAAGQWVSRATVSGP